MIKGVLRVFGYCFCGLITFVFVLILSIGVTGGIMYLNEKLNQYGTIWLGG